MTSLSFGANGSYVASGQTVIDGKYLMVCALSDSTVMLENNWVGAPAIVTVPMVAGQTVYGIFESVEVASGAVVAYK